MQAGAGINGLKPDAWDWPFDKAIMAGRHGVGGMGRAGKKPYLLLITSNEFRFGDL
ncbi:hypothetical protein [Paracoccus sediminilitoris]|uniref:hypothetical protein n=1 Tax=Paracoccus sediminilitoris TaxID=2202419 RepID=UPI00272C9FD5|nr:hypothetical protein [Paracoccus sediminilitoris]